MSELIFNPILTTKQLVHCNEKGLAQTDPYWNFGFDGFTNTFTTLRSGLFFVVAPENTGKTQFLVNLGYNILTYNEDAYWLDFTIDDSIEKRYSYLIARVGNIPINLVQVAGKASEEERIKRKAAFTHFNKNYRARFRTIGTSSNKDLDVDVHYTVDWISKQILQAREQIGEERKLVVTIDSFYDVDVKGAGPEENARLAAKSQMFKRCAGDADALLILSGHSRKDSRHRNVTLDVLKGEGRIAYDAEIAVHLYCDVDIYGSNADIYWQMEGDLETKYPTCECRVLKTKAGGRKGTVVFFEQLPSHCYLQESSDSQTAYYREVISGLTKKEIKSKKSYE